MILVYTNQPAGAWHRPYTTSMNINMEPILHPSLCSQLGSQSTISKHESSPSKFHKKGTLLIV